MVPLHNHGSGLFVPLMARFAMLLQVLSFSVAQVKRSNGLGKMRHRERRPTAVLQFTTVEEPGAVVSRARAIAARQRSASNPALPLPLTGLTDPPSASTHTGAVFDEVGCTQRARASSLDISSTATDVAPRMSAPSALVQLATTALPPLASRVLDWDPDEEADQQDWEDFGSDACSSLSSTGRQWHSHSVDGSHTAAGEQCSSLLPK